MSKKTAAAIAAEQQTTEDLSAVQDTTLPAVTLDELEQFDIGPSSRRSARPSASRTTAAQTGPSARSWRSVPSTSV